MKERDVCGIVRSIVTFGKVSFGGSFFTEKIHKGIDRQDVTHALMWANGYRILSENEEVILCSITTKDLNGRHLEIQMEIYKEEQAILLLDVT